MGMRTGLKSMTFLYAKRQSQVLWINGWFSYLGMFLVAISASVLRLYFDDAWNQVEINQEIVDQKRKEHEKSAKYAAVSSSDRSEVPDTGSDSDSDANVTV